MTPWVTRRSDGELVPLTDNYVAEMWGIGIGRVDSEGNPIKPSEKQREYHKKLFGQDLIKSEPWLYTDTQVMLETGLAAEWEDLPVRLRARIKAALQLKNMADILSHHRDLQEEQMKKTGFGGKL